jgi:hypothetical protein
VASLQKRIKTAVADCPSVILSLKGKGSSTATVRAINPPDVGADPFGIRITATGGALDGMEVTIFSTGIGDTVLSMGFVASFPEDRRSGLKNRAPARSGSPLGAGRSSWIWSWAKVVSKSRPW